MRKLLQRIAAWLEQARHPPTIPLPSEGSAYAEELSPMQRLICKKLHVGRSSYKRRCRDGVQTSNVVPPGQGRLFWTKVSLGHWPRPVTPIEVPLFPEVLEAARVSYFGGGDEDLLRLVWKFLRWYGVVALYAYRPSRWRLRLGVAGIWMRTYFCVRFYSAAAAAS